MLISALAGRELLFNSYKAASKRTISILFSFGDAMFIR